MSRFIPIVKLEKNWKHLENLAHWVQSIEICVITHKTLSSNLGGVRVSTTSDIAIKEQRSFGIN